MAHESEGVLTPAQRAAEIARTAHTAASRASDALPEIDIGGALVGAVDEFHRQQEWTATLVRWGTVAFAAFAALAIVLVLAWFAAPIRTALAGVL